MADLQEVLDLIDRAADRGRITRRELAIVKRAYRKAKIEHYRASEAHAFAHRMARAIGVSL